MVSQVLYAKFPLLNFTSSMQNTFRLIGIILFVVVFGASIIIGYPYQVLAVFVSFYILSGILKHIITLGNIELKNQET